MEIFRQESAADTAGEFCRVIITQLALTAVKKSHSRHQADLQSGAHASTRALKTIFYMQKATAIAAAAVKLRFAVSSPTLSSIAGAANTLVQSVGQAQPHPLSTTSKKY